VRLSVSWTAQAAQQLSELQHEYPQVQQLAHDLIAQDPRPAYQRGPAEYGMHIYDLNIRFRVSDTQAIILSVERI
jgi:hypothetical protein